MKNYKNIVIAVVCVVVLSVIVWGAAALLNKKPVETEAVATPEVVETETPIVVVEVTPEVIAPAESNG